MARMMMRDATILLERAARSLRAALAGPRPNWFFRCAQIVGFADSGRKTPMASASNRSTPEWTRADSRLAERREDLLERLHLIARRRRRHEDRRVHAGRAPGGDALAHLGRGAEQRVVGQPLVG